MKALPIDIHYSFQFNIYVGIFNNSLTNLPHHWVSPLKIIIDFQLFKFV